MDYGFVLNGNIADMPFSKVPLLLNTAVPHVSSNIIGFVGLDAFSTSIISIDLVNSRVLLTDTISEVMDSIKGSVVYEKYTSVYGLPAVTVYNMGKSQGLYIFDTGISGADGVIFNIENWKKMTGKEIDDFRNKKTRKFSQG